MAGLEKIGVIGVFENLSGYLEAFKKANEAVTKHGEAAKKSASVLTAAGKSTDTEAAALARLGKAEEIAASTAAEFKTANDKVTKSSEAATTAVNNLKQAEASLARAELQRIPKGFQGAGQFRKVDPQQVAQRSALVESLKPIAETSLKIKGADTAAAEVLRLKAAAGSLLPALNSLTPATVAHAQAVAAINPKLATEVALLQQQVGVAPKAAKGHSELAKNLLNVAKAAATAFVVYKGLGIIKTIIGDTVELGVATFKLQEVMGGSAKTASGLIFALGQFGVSKEEVLGGFEVLARNLALVQENAAGLNTRGQQSTRVFSALGIAVLDANGNLNPTIDILEELADKFAASDDAALKSGIAAQIFGEAFGRQVIPFLNEGSAGIEKLIARADELGVSLTDKGALSALEFAQSQKELSAALKGVEIQIGNQLLPLIASFATKLTAFLTENRAAITSWAAAGGKALGQFGKGAALGLKQLNELLGFLPKNQRVIIAAIAAIGAALVLAFGTPGLVVAGLVAIIANLEKIEGLSIGNGLKGLPTKTDILKQKQADLQKQLDTDTRARVPNIPGGIQGAGPIGGNAGELFRKFFDAVGITSGKLEDRTATEKELAEVTAEIAKLDAEAAEAARKKAAAEAAAKDGAKGTGAELNTMSDAMKQAIALLHDLANEFRDSSRAAGQVDSLIDSIKTFGQVSQELAAKLTEDGTPVDAITAGNLQGFDAVEASVARADAKVFDFTRSLATVAQAAAEAASGVKGAAQALAELTLSIAQLALQSAQTAASNLFSRPTREVADLNVDLSHAKLNSAQTEQRINPQVETLQRSISDKSAERAITAQERSIDKEIKAVDRAEREARKAFEAAKKQRDDAKKGARDAARRADDAAQAALDQLKLNNLIQQQAFERMIARIDELISATQKQASDLQEAFLKSNEALQRQINEAIGRGDTQGALKLVDTQRTAADAYHRDALALRKHEQQLESQKKTVERQEAEFNRQAQLAEALAQASEHQRKAAEDEALAAIENTEAVDFDSDAFDAHKDALEDQKAALDDQKQGLEDHNQAIQGQIDALTKQTDATKSVEDRINEQIAVYEAETGVLKAMVDASDATLFSQQEQADAAHQLAGMIAFESEQVRLFAEKTGKSLIPGMDDAVEQFDLLKKALELEAIPSLRDKFIHHGVDFAGLKAHIFGLALQSDADAVRDHELAMLTASGVIKRAAAKIENAAAADPPKTNEITPPHVGNIGLKDQLPDFSRLITQLDMATAALIIFSNDGLTVSLAALSNLVTLEEAQGAAIEANTAILEVSGEALSALNSSYLVQSEAAQELVSAQLDLVAAAQAQVQVTEQYLDSQLAVVAAAVQGVIASQDLGNAEAIAAEQVLAEIDSIQSLMAGMSGNLDLYERLSAQLDTSVASLQALLGSLEPLPGDLRQVDNAMRQVDNGSRAAVNSLGRISPAVSNLVSAISSAAAAIKSAATAVKDSQTATKTTDTKTPPTPTGAGTGQGKANAEGGIYSSPTLLLVGETHQKELVLPLERPARARELLSRVEPRLIENLILGTARGRTHRSRELRQMLPGGFIADLMRSSQGGQNVFAPHISVTGETLESMEATALRAVRVAFRQASATSQRGGGTITQGLGPLR